MIRQSNLGWPLVPFTFRGRFFNRFLRRVEHCGPAVFCSNRAAFLFNNHRENEVFTVTNRIEIKEPRAKELLDAMADMDLITVQQVDVEKPRGNSEREQTPRSGREAIMSLAGSWNGMSENDLQEYLSEAERSGGEIFDRDVSL